MDRMKEVERKFIALFNGAPETWVRAPGRVDLMGSHTDYNQGFVLTLAIDKDTWIAGRPRSDGLVRICSTNLEGCGEFPFSKITSDETVPWTNYVRGVADVMFKAGYPLPGFDGLVDSTIPFSSGLSSSAAIEIAAAMMFVTLGGLRIDKVEIAKLCQRAENEFVGVNCGILDQYSSMMGEAGKVLLLDCRAITSEAMPVAPDILIMICDTKAKRELIGSEYPERRAQCEAGARFLSRYYPEVESLRDATIDQLEAQRENLPEVVYKRCQFVIEENQRVFGLAEALALGDRERIRNLTSGSFEGARDLYEICTDEMKSMQEAMMSAPGVIGARQAGAGFGGCMVAIIEERSVLEFATHVGHRYLEETEIQADIYPARASPGAGLLNFADL